MDLHHLRPQWSQNSETQPVGQPGTTDPALVQTDALGPGKTLEGTEGQPVTSVKNGRPDIPQNWLSLERCASKLLQSLCRDSLCNFGLSLPASSSKRRKGGETDRLEVRE